MISQVISIMILFFYGEDDFRLKQKIKQLKAKFIASSLGDVNLVVLDGKTASYEQIVRQILAMPFLARKRLVIIENLLKAGQKDTKEKVADFLKKVPDSTVLVFVEEGIPDRRVVLFKRLNQPQRAQEFKLLEGEPLRRWIRQEVSVRGAVIESEAVSQLVGRVGPDLWRMTNELAKLIAYQPKITSATIELLIIPQTQENIFNLIEAVTHKNIQKAVHELYQLFQAGHPALYILSMLVYGYRNLLIIKDLQTKIRSRWELGRKAGLHPYVVLKNLEILANYERADLKKIYAKLLDFDQMIKTGRIEPKVALELLIFELGGKVNERLGAF